MTYFISYDISNVKRLQQVSKLLENYGIRVQYSFFQCDMDKARIAELTQTLLTVIDRKADSLLIMPVCANCLEPYALLGFGSIIAEEKYQIL